MEFADANLERTFKDYKTVRLTVANYSFLPAICN